MYRLSVTPLKGLIKYEEQDIRWKDKPDANPRKIDRMREGLKENGSTELSRALFRKLSDEIWEKNAIILAVRWHLDKAVHPFPEFYSKNFSRADRLILRIQVFRMKRYL